MKHAATTVGPTTSAGSRAMPTLRRAAYLATAATISVILAGCALLKPPPAISSAPVQTGQLAEQRAAQKSGAVAVAQSRPGPTPAALDVDRINQKLAGNAETSSPSDCGERDMSPHADAHATWGDTLPELQRRKACTAKRGTSR